MDENIYISFLYKKLSGEIEPSETKQLNDWLAESEEHQQIAKAVEKAWSLGANYTQEVKVDLDADFALLQKRMDAEELDPPVVKMNPVSTPKANRRSLFSKWQIAASVLFLILAGFLLQRTFSGSTNWKEHYADARMDKAILLADGTKVWVNAGSTFSYPEAFEGGERKVKLTGEAFFDVAKDAAHPFIIETGTGSVKVLGTSFNVRDFKTEGTMSVDVVTGKVRVAIAETAERVDLVKNEQAIYDRKNKTLKSERSNANNSSAWHTRKLRFSNIAFAKAISEIEKAYAVTVAVENAALKECPLTSDFDQFEIKDLLENVSLVYGAKLVEKGNGNYVLQGGKCE